MLKRTTLRNHEYPSKPPHDRRLQHNEKDNMLSLGCTKCLDREVCGGLNIKAAMYSCEDHCCGSPDTCDLVCRLNQKDFVNRIREVNTFDLNNVPRAEPLPSPSLIRVVPVIYHASRREKALDIPMAALSLYRMFGRRDNIPYFTSHEEMCEAYKIKPGTPIILTGTATDRPLERWWGLKETKRRQIISSLRDNGVLLVTTPNYSVFTEVPRWDNLHSIKRIAITHQEFISEGLPAALHVNGRTDQDFYRWAEYINERPEITHIAYEFTTGTKWAERAELHAAWLSYAAKAVKRPLHLVVRGGISILPLLAGSFKSITFLETSIFMKTMMRKKAIPKGNADIEWTVAHTENGAPLDDLLLENYYTVTEWVSNTYLPLKNFNKSSVNE